LIASLEKELDFFIYLNTYTILCCQVGYATWLSIRFIPKYESAVSVFSCSLRQPRKKQTQSLNKGTPWRKINGVEAVEYFVAMSVRAGTPLSIKMAVYWDCDPD